MTAGEFEEFIRDNSYTGAKPVTWNISPLYIPTSYHPVVFVRWYDAILFCNWLSLKEGRSPAYREIGREPTSDPLDIKPVFQEQPKANGYRLLYEMEWEHACRAGTETKWSPGDDETLLANYFQESTNLLSEFCGQKLPNAWGIHDMHGNVHEWCWDSIDTRRVLRGGSVVSKPAQNVSAARLEIEPWKGGGHLGFRVALSSSGIPGPAEP